MCDCPFRWYHCDLARQQFDGSGIRSVCRFGNDVLPSGGRGHGNLPRSLPVGYTVNGASMNYNLPLNPGTYSTVIVAWDKCGGASTAGIRITVKAGGGKSFTNIQRAGGWGEYGQGLRSFIDCSPSPFDGISFWMAQGTKSPSLSGDATEYDLGGTTPTRTLCGTTT